MGVAGRANRVTAEIHPERRSTLAVLNGAYRQYSGHQTGLAWVA
jgi:hypothetical protein